MSSLKKNIAFMYLLQAANYVIPFITVPYLSRVLGVTNFGFIGLASAVIGVMGLISDWGFSLTATQKAALRARDQDALHRLFWDVFWARIGLGVLAFVGLAIVITMVTSLRSLGIIMVAASVQVIASMLSVGWFLQGLERMGAFVWTFLFGRALAVPLTFLFVRGPQDTAVAVLIPGICSLISCYISFKVAARLVELFPIRFDLKGMRRELYDGAQIFISTGAINLYTQSNILILGALTNSVQIGTYYGAERIRRAVQSLIGPAGVALFPRINSLMSHDPSAAKQLMKNMLIMQGGFSFLTSVTMFVLAPWGVPVALGSDYVAAIPVVQWLSPLPFIIGISNVLGVNIMLPLGMKTQFAWIVSASALVNFLTMLVLCPTYGGVGAAMSLIVAESFVTSAMGLVLYIRRS